MKEILTSLLLVAGVLFGVVGLARNPAVQTGGGKVDRDFDSSTSVGSSKSVKSWTSRFLEQEWRLLSKRRSKS